MRHTRELKGEGKETMKAIETVGEEIDERFSICLDDLAGLGERDRYAVCHNGRFAFRTSDLGKAKAKYEELRAMWEDFKRRVAETLA